MAIKDTPGTVMQQQPVPEVLTLWECSMVFECSAQGEVRALDMAQCLGAGAIASQRHGATS